MSANVHAAQGLLQSSTETFLASSAAAATATASAITTADPFALSLSLLLPGKLSLLTTQMAGGAAALCGAAALLTCGRRLTGRKRPSEKDQDSASSSRTSASTGMCVPDDLSVYLSLPAHRWVYAGVIYTPGCELITHARVCY